MIVYSIIDRQSFHDIHTAKGQIERIKSDATLVMALVGNKSDKDSERAVATKDGEALANTWKCSFLPIEMFVSSNRPARLIHNLRRCYVYTCHLQWW